MPFDHTIWLLFDIENRMIEFYVNTIISESDNTFIMYTYV